MERIERPQDYPKGKRRPAGEVSSSLAMGHSVTGTAQREQVGFGIIASSPALFVVFLHTYRNPYVAQDSGASK